MRRAGGVVVGIEVVEVVLMMMSLQRREARLHGGHALLEGLVAMLEGSQILSDPHHQLGEPDKRVFEFDRGLSVDCAVVGVVALFLVARSHWRDLSSLQWGERWRSRGVVLRR